MGLQEDRVGLQDTCILHVHANREPDAPFARGKGNKVLSACGNPFHRFLRNAQCYFGGLGIGT